MAKKVKKGQVFTSSGSRWTEGDEVPACNFCGEDYFQLEKASGLLHETCVSGVYVCGKDECLVRFALDEGTRGEVELEEE